MDKETKHTREYHKTTMTVCRDKWDTEVSIDGFIIFETEVNVSKKQKVITVKKVISISAWYEDCGDEVCLEDFEIEKAEYYLMTSFLIGGIR